MLEFTVRVRISLHLVGSVVSLDSPDIYFCLQERLRHNEYILKIKSGTTVLIRVTFEIRETRTHPVPEYDLKYS